MIKIRGKVDKPTQTMDSAVLIISFFIEKRTSFWKFAQSAGAVEYTD